MKKNKLIIAILALIIVASCSQGLEIEDTAPFLDNNKAILIESPTWKEKLERIKKSPPVALKNGKIALLKYELIDCIDCKSKVESVKSTLKSDPNMIPYYQNDFRSISAISKTKARSLSSKEQEYDFSRSDRYIDTCITEGMDLIKLTWENNGEIINTYCVVSGENDIVYDNFITNALIINESTATIYVEDETTPQTKASSLGPNFSGFVNWSHYIHADWLFGGERGYAGVEHRGNYYYGGFTYHTYSASHYMSIGNSKAEVKNESSGGNRNGGRISYAAGISTPYLDINIQYSNSGFTIGFEGFIGSKAGISGSHFFPYSSNSYYE